MSQSYIASIPDQKWVSDRKNYIGGSDVAAILGTSSYSTPLQLWMRKKGLIPPIDQTSIMEFGHVFEPVMAEYFTQKTGLRVRNINQVFRSKEHDFLRANIDRQILSDGSQGTGVLEIKTTTSFRLKSLDTDYPEDWDYQIQHYLAITGYEYAYLFIYERDTCRFHEPVRIMRDERWIQQVTQLLVDWWKKHMVNNQRPAPQNGEDMLILYPDSKDGSATEASLENYEKYARLLDVRRRKEELEVVEEYLKTYFKGYLKDSERMVRSGQTLVSWKSSESNRFDTTRFRKEYPDLYKKYVKSTSTRRFTVTTPKGE